MDDWRDAEPGKILHELRDRASWPATGELPHTPVLRLGRLDAAVADPPRRARTTGPATAACVDRLWPNAMAALEWIDSYGDRDGDGFVEYERRSSRGLLNQGWKDSQRRDPRPGRRGRPMPPIALAEVQGYVYDAKRRLAALARVRGETELADPPGRRGRGAARPLRRGLLGRGPGHYAIALDGDKRQADAIASNAGQCLWTGIVAARTGRRAVAERPAEPAMFSGWGIRTYAAGQPGYNPIGYHTGHGLAARHALIARGLKRYGFDDEANRLVGRVLEAAQHFPEYRLPELFCGFDRDDSPHARAVPGRLLAAGMGGRVARSCSSRPCSGCAPHADRRELELRHPHLPDWLGKVTLHEPARRRGPRSTCCSTAGGARPAPRSCARSATSPSRSGCEAATATVTQVGELLREGTDRLREPARRRRASTRSSCWDTPSGSIGPRSSPTPRRRSAPTRQRRYRGGRRAAGGRRAGRLHPRAQGVLRARLHGRCAGR